MRIIVSVQSKRGSARGLVHYIAHSKIDPEREHSNARELFNEFADSLSVKSANNSLKTDISGKRPPNEQLHHLVLSFRAEDFKRFGADDASQKRAAKEIVRAAVAKLEESLNAERFAWAAALHLNTANPHVHIALQKQYFTKETERREMTKVPREALPHYERSDHEDRRFVPGILFDAAMEKMEQVIGRDRGRKHDSVSTHERDERFRSDGNEVSEMLARWLLQKDELNRCERSVESLFKDGKKLRLPVSDPATGKKRKISLRDIERRDEKRAFAECRKRGISDPGEIASIREASVSSEMERRAPMVRQLHAILHSLTVKEETKRMRLAEAFKRIDNKVGAVRRVYRKQGHKLPVPALRKEEIDRLQEGLLAEGDLRGFGYLERARDELEASGRIPPRTPYDLDKLLAEKTIGELRAKYGEKTLREVHANRYSRSVDIDGKQWSVFAFEKHQQLEHSKHAFPRNVLTRLGIIAAENKPAEATIRRDKIIEKLDAEDRQLQKEISLEAKTAKLISGIIEKYRGNEAIHEQAPIGIEQIAQIEGLSFRLKEPKLFDQSWKLQQELIGNRGPDCGAGRMLQEEGHFEKKKTEILAGRALARETMAGIELARTKERLRKFADTRRFHKFELKNEEGVVQFVALNDVETNRSGSFLDQVVDLLVEDGEVRKTRTIVKNLIKEREADLTKDAKAASEIFTIASKTADQFRSMTLFGLKKSSPYQPIFTPAELSAIEGRLIQSTDRRETKELEKIYLAAIEKPAENLVRTLRDFAHVDEPKNGVAAKEQEIQRRQRHENVMTR